MVMRDYNGVKIYKFYFSGINDPILIEAVTLDAARKAMNDVWNRLPMQYSTSFIIGETVTVPVEGVTTKTEKGVEYTWVGYEKTKNGWQDTASLLKEVDYFDQIKKTHSI